MLASWCRNFLHVVPLYFIQLCVTLAMWEGERGPAWVQLIAGGVALAGSSSVRV